MERKEIKLNFVNNFSVDFNENVENQLKTAQQKNKEILTELIDWLKKELIYGIGRDVVHIYESLPEWAYFALDEEYYINQFNDEQQVIVAIDDIGGCGGEIVDACVADTYENALIKMATRHCSKDKLTAQQVIDKIKEKHQYMAGLIDELWEEKNTNEQQ